MPKTSSSRPLHLPTLLRFLATAVSTGTLSASAGCSGTSNDDLFQNITPTSGDASVVGGDGGSLSLDSAVGPSDGALQGDGAPSAEDAGSLAVCEAGVYAPLGKVTPALPVDYMEFWTGQEAARPPFGSSDPKGTPCATATNKPACQTALEQLRQKTQTGWPVATSTDFRGGPQPAPPLRSLLFTRGDAVGAVSTIEALGRFVAPIENPSDAALIASQSMRGSFACGTDRVRLTSLAGGGYEVTFVRKFSDPCASHGRAESVVEVQTDGRIRFTNTTYLEPKTPPPECKVKVIAVGRRPHGLDLQASPTNDNPLGQFFAQAAALEGASVPAFARLAMELAHYGAPPSLVDEALRACEDEVGHTAMMNRLAVRFGAGEATIPELSLEPRSLLEVALENAIEGSLRETFGALVAHYQSQHAASPLLARVFARVAADETRHAELSMAVNAWLHPLLSVEEKATVARAKEEALGQLFQDLAEAPHKDLVHHAGMPTPTVARSLLQALGAHLWANPEAVG